MIEKATILKKVKKDFYEIKVQEEKNCLSCSMSDRCHDQNKSIIARSKNIYEVGDKVSVIIKEKDESIRVFLVFILPLLSGIIGIFLSFKFFFPKNNLIAFFFFVAFFFLSLKLGTLFDKKNNDRLPFIINKIIE